MIDIFSLWEEFIGTVNTRQGGSVKPHRNFTRWVHSISLALYEEKFSGWGKSQKIRDDLSSPFLTSTNLQVKDVPGANYGFCIFPPNYGHIDAVRFFSNGEKGVPLPGIDVHDCTGKKEADILESRPAWMSEEIWEILRSEAQATQQLTGPVNQDEKPVDIIPSERWGAALVHRRNKPTLDNPKVTQFDRGLKVAPAGVGIIVLDYLKKPSAPKFVYKVTPGDPQTGEGDIMVYDPEKSVHLEWTELVRNEFINRLETKYGKFIREQFLYQAADNDRKQNV